MLTGDVSARNLAAYLEYMVVQGIDPDELLDGLPITATELKNPALWVDWDLFADVMERIEAKLGPEGMRALGRFGVNTEVARPLKRIAGVAFKLRHIYRFGALWMLPLVMRHVKVDLQVLDDQHLRLEVTLPSHFRPVPSWLRLVEGVMAALPEYMGLPHARVEARIQPYVAVYDVHLPAQRFQLRQSLRRGLRVLLGDTELRELERQLEDIQDIERERSRLERTLLERERVLSHLLSDLPALVYRASASDFSLEYMSGNAARLTGETSEDLTKAAASLEAIVHPEDRASLRMARQQALQARLPCTREYRVVRKDGSVVWVLDVAHGVYDRRGQPLAIEGFITDTTERKRLEEEVRKAAHLESVGRLAGGVAHDFNNMLTVITGFVELGRAEIDEGGSARECLDEISRAADHSAALTRQLLAFARKQTMQPKIININDLVRNMEKLLQRTLMEDVLFSFSPGRDLWNVDIDPGQVEQVLLNLAINARDAMPDGGVLALETGNLILDEPSTRRPGLKPGAYVLLRLKDNGQGMPPEVLRNAFEPFFTTKPAGKGTGLGLSSVQGIITQAGGKIFMDSKLGLGTRFDIYLPRSKREPEPQQPREASSQSTTGARVLLVEDHDTLRELLADGLRREGFSVVAAASGSDAVNKLTALEFAIDVLVTDVVMPIMSGPEVAQRVRQHCPQLPVILVSGFTEHHQLEFSSEGYTRFLAKPFTPAKLAETIGEVLSACPASQRELGPVVH